MNIVSREHPLNHYQWGDSCDGWNLSEDRSLTIKLEKMPPHTAEQNHYHTQSQQFFFILKGMAEIETGEGVFNVCEQQGLHIRAGLTHRIINRSDGDLEFLLASHPSTADDRINI